MKKRMLLIFAALAVTAISQTAFAEEYEPDFDSGETEIIEDENDVYEPDSYEPENESEDDFSLEGDFEHAVDVWTDDGDWQQAYLEAIASSPVAELGASLNYALIYVDEDNVPELLCYSGFEASGCQVYTWHEGTVSELQTSRLGYSYIENGNRFRNSDGHMGYFFDYVYTIENGQWVTLGAGDYSDIQGQIPVYKWNGFDVTREDYNEKLDKIYDADLAQMAPQYYTRDEMIAILQTGGTGSEGHRYEVVRKDVTWSEAQAQCEAKGGYLATLTSQEEFDAVSELIKQAGCSNCFVWVGGSSKYSTQYGYYWLDPQGEYDMLTTSFFPFWMDGEPSYTGLTENGVRMDEDSVAMLYIRNEDRFYLNDAPDDVLTAAPSYAGIIAYVCEYDQ